MNSETIALITRGSDSTSWGTLLVKVLDSHLGLPAVSTKYATAVLSHCLPLVLLAICFLRLLRPRKEVNIHTRVALRALLAVIVPTCSLWPSHYIRLASIFRSRVDIPLEVIIEDTVDGIIEFRNPVNDLADLIGPGAHVNGHTICIMVGWKWWISCFQWWMLAKPKSGYMIRLLDWLHGNMPPANSSPLGVSLIPSALALPASHPLFCLDHLPHNSIPFLNAGCKTTLELTTFSSSLRVLSTPQIVSAIPFIMSKRSCRRPRSLVSVLQQLGASYGPKLAVDSLSNVSADYERMLCHVYKSLSVEQKIRETGMTNLDIRARRRDLFLVALEAALVRRGWIERWAVQVTTQ